MGGIDAEISLRISSKAPQAAIFADMADRDEAVCQAKLAAKEAMLDGIVGGADPTSWVAKAYDIAGYLVATLDSKI